MREDGVVQPLTAFLFIVHWTIMFGFCCHVGIIPHEIRTQLSTAHMDVFFPDPATSRLTSPDNTRICCRRDNVLYRPDVYEYKGVADMLYSFHVIRCRQVMYACRGTYAKAF